MKQPALPPRFCVPTRTFLCVSFLGLVATCLFALLGDDTELFLVINRWSHAYIHSFFLALLTSFGHSIVANLFIIIALVRYPKASGAIVLAVAGVFVSIQGLKHGFSFPRPAAVLPTDTFNIVGDALRKRSFPSGHSATVWATAALICCFIRPLWLQIGLIIVATMVALSRISVGAHWPIDVLVGSWIGWSLTALILYIWHNKLSNPKVTGVTLVILSLFPLSFLLYGSSDIEVLTYWYMGCALLSLALIVYGAVQLIRSW